jgi:hypothetical protein
MREREVEGVLAVVGDQDLETAAGEEPAEEVLRYRIVLDDEDGAAAAAAHDFSISGPESIARGSKI